MVQICVGINSIDKEIKRNIMPVLEMHDEIFHENFEIFQDPFLKYYMKLLIFNIK